MRYITRSEWGARPPKGRSTIRAQGVKVHYNGPGLNSLPADHNRCAPAVRGIQRYHMDSRGWWDLAYSHLCCPHGYVYEGRGVGTRTAANGTSVCNSNYEAVMGLIGEGQPAYDDLRRGIRDAVAHHQAHGTGTHVGVHSDCKATACPGEPLRAWVRAGLPAPGGEPPPPPPPPPDDWRERVMSKPVLRKSARGHEVRLLQTLLVAHGNRPGGWYGDPSEGPDGIFGDGVEMVLSAWQRRTGLLNNHELGFCGPRTWAWLVGV